MDWKEALRLVTEHAGKGDAEAREVVTAIQTTAPKVFQPIFNMGHGDATGRSSDRLTALQGELATAQANVTRLEGELKTARESTPSTKALAEQHQTELEKLDKRHKDKIQSLEQALESARVEAVLAEARTELTGKVDEDYRDKVLLADPAVRKRIRFTDAGVREITQSGSDIRLSPADPKDLVKMFAQDLLSAVPAKWRLSNGDAGGGAGSGGNSGGGGGGGGGTGNTDLVGSFIQKMEKQAASRPNPLQPHKAPPAAAAT